MRRRSWLQAAALSAPVFIRHARAADTPRFELGVASGQPRSDGMVLWTRLTGPDLPPQVQVHWDVAHDEAFTRIVARGSDTAEQALGAQRACRAGGPGAGALVLVPLPGAGPGQPHRPHAHCAGTRCRGHAAAGHRQLPALGPRPLRRLAPPGHGRTWTWWPSWATTSTSTRRGRPRCAGTTAACCARWTSTARATPSTRATRRCRTRTPPAPG
jgi:hypothetical protein